MAFADILEAEGLDENLIKTIGSGFGGGFARMREVCGSFHPIALQVAPPFLCVTVPAGPLIRGG